MGSGRMRYLVKENNCTILLDSPREKYYKAIEDYLKATAKLLSAVDRNNDWVDFSKLMVESLKVLIEKHGGGS